MENLVALAQDRVINVVVVVDNACNHIDDVGPEDGAHRLLVVESHFGMLHLEENEFIILAHEFHLVLVEVHHRILSNPQERLYNVSVQEGESALDREAYHLATHVIVMLYIAYYTLHVNQ